ncbi:four helix bundle protein [bacterium]|nr:four helix bundle protein [bacterium]
MAQYQHLSLYKTTYDLLLQLMHITKNYPREFKYSIGEKIQDYITEILLDIYRANGSKEKKPHLQNLLERVELLNVLLRVSFDLKILTVEKYANLIEKTTSISKQTNGWMKV